MGRLMGERNYLYRLADETANIYEHSMHVARSRKTVEILWKELELKVDQ